MVSENVEQPIYPRQFGCAESVSEDHRANVQGHYICEVIAMPNSAISRVILPIACWLYSCEK